MESSATKAPYETVVAVVRDNPEKPELYLVIKDTASSLLTDHVETVGSSEEDKSCQIELMNIDKDSIEECDVQVHETGSDDGYVCVYPSGSSVGEFCEVQLVTIPQGGVECNEEFMEFHQSKENRVSAGTNVTDRPGEGAQTTKSSAIQNGGPNMDDSESDNEEEYVEVVDYVAQDDDRFDEASFIRSIVENYSESTQPKLPGKDVDKHELPTCHVCRAVFLRRKDLLSHLDMHRRADDRIWGCDWCRATFSSVKELKEHIPFHAESVICIARCDICDVPFQTRKGLVQHLEAHGEKRRSYYAEKNLLCHICGRHFSKIGFLKRHVEDHKDHDKSPQASQTVNWVLNQSPDILMKKSKKYAPISQLCYICGYTFENKNEFTKHVRGHKRFPCESCGKIFHTRPFLTAHKKQHQLFFCETCGKTLSTKSGYVYHMMSHKVKAGLQL